MENSVQNEVFYSNENSQNFLIFKKPGSKKEIFTKVDIDFIKYLQNVTIEREIIENLTGFRVHNISLYQNAFVHKSVLQIVKTLQNLPNQNYKFPQFMQNSNERLEFLGDSIYNMALCSYIYERFPTQPEGFLSRLNALVKNKNTLSMFSSKLGLYNYILMVKPPQVNSEEFKFSNSILEDTFESFVAAIFLDHGGFNGNGCKFVYHFVKKCVETFIDNDDEFNDPIKDHDKFVGPKQGLKNFMLSNVNYKDILQRHCQANYNTIPVYKVLNETGCGHSIEFTVNVFINDTVIPNCINKGKTKKHAEQGSAMKALSELKVEDSRDSDYFDNSK
jgi:ribonuclease-3